ncbi:hypothetical protein E2C01_041835 [Portunus trituberculatus]|uniref:Uncharacterized protein n=1 Tax=Portunus trituberculatus TaxID=210409 RepID=A0A5B7FK85_PORTR|nr:hypothetical protein [Portunus trituberculatus]
MVGRSGTSEHSACTLGPPRLSAAPRLPGEEHVAQYCHSTVSLGLLCDIYSSRDFLVRCATAFRHTRRPSWGHEWRGSTGDIAIASVWAKPAVYQGEEGGRGTVGTSLPCCSKRA